MDHDELMRTVLAQLDEITGKTDPAAPGQLEPALFRRLDQVAKIVSSIQRYLPKRVIDKILLNPDGVKVEGERRPVTVLFGDLSGFTAMSETMDPEQVVEVVNQYFDTMVEIAERYGGHIDKFMGDALMVLFGAPVVHEDDALRACLAAVEMLEAMDRFSAERKMDLAMSIGLNTGEVVALNVGSKGRMEYTVIGDAVNLAARLEKVATARQCVIGENTFRQVKGKIRLQKLKPVMVKGKSKPQNVYLILGRVESAEAAAGLRAGSIKMVGRLAEMDAIRGAVGQAKAGSGRAVAITGGPGLGKSRLAKELELQARDEGFAFVKGKCYAYSQSVAYLPFLRQLQLLLAVQDADGAGKKRERLRETLQAQDLADFEPFLGSLLGIAYPEIDDLDPQKRKRRTFEGFTSLFHRESAKRPLALAFEDLQWADSLSLELLEHLAGTVADKPILLCCDYRPELALPFIARPWCTSIVLDALDRREVFQMAAALSGVADVTDAVLDRICERTEGNPLFVEEIIRHLLSRRLVRREADKLVPAKRFGTMVLPNTVSGVVLGRIDKLSEELRRTLQYASVIGKEFDPGLLAHITKTPDEQLRRQLDNLEHFQGLLYSKEAESRRLYQFHSTTTQEAAYGTLLKQRRKELHGSVAQTYEREYQGNLEPWLEDLAHHYYHSAFEGKAVQYLHKAGDKVRGLFANAEAIEFYEKGIGVLKKAKDCKENKLELAELLGAQGAVLRLVGQREQALKNFRKAVSTAKAVAGDFAHRKYQVETGIVYNLLDESTKARAIWNVLLKDPTVDVAIQARVLNNIGYDDKNRGDFSKAEKHFNEAVAIFKAIGDKKEIARSLLNIGTVKEAINDTDSALRFYAEALSILGNGPYVELQALLNNNLGALELIMNDTVAANSHLDEAQRLALKIGDRQVQTLSLGNLGLISALEGDYAHASERFEASLAAAIEIGDVRQQMSMRTNLGCVDQVQGEYKQATVQHREALATAIRIRDVANQSEIERNLGLDLTALGCYCEAMRHFESSLAQTEAIGDQRMIAYIKAGLGNYHHAIGNLAAAIESLNAALEGARAAQDPEVILFTARGLTECLIDLGDFENARQHIGRRLGLAEKTDNKREYAYALLNLVEVHVLNNDYGAVANEFAEALSVAREIKDKVLIARLCLAAAQSATQLHKGSEAEGYLKDASEFAERTCSPELLWQVEYARGKYEESLGLRDKANGSYGRARAIVGSMAQQLPEEMREPFMQHPRRKTLFI